MKYTLEELNNKKKKIIGFDYGDPDECLEAVKRDENALQYVKEQTKEICLAAVKRDELALVYVKEQTEETCLTGGAPGGVTV